MRRYRIGRAETNDIVLDEPSVSREHAELTKHDRGAFLLRDLGSTYGTSARQGADWHLVTAENVDYDTPLRIGEFETSVARLLREVDPLAVYMDSTEPPWAAPGSRLTPEEHAQRPETIHIGWGPGEAPAPLFPPQPATKPPSPVRASRYFVFLSMIGLGAVATAALTIVATAVL
jgi:predicted component of type VI protein secretion system